MNNTNTLSIKDQWLLFRKENPRIRIRDAARQLGTTEAEILASFSGSSVMRLHPDWSGILSKIQELGKIMSLTRNESCVHERKGVFEQVDTSNKHVGLVLGKDIDLRMFFGAWAFAFAVMEDETAGFKNSVQVFDHQGTAVIKFFLQESSNKEKFDELIRAFSLPVQEESLVLKQAAKVPDYNDGKIDVEAFQLDWSMLKDTHDFFPLLKKYNVSRLHALEIAGDFSRRLNNEAVKKMLHAAADQDWEIMVFVGNHGNIQIHTGPVKNILEIPGWINVMDPEFNLHLKLDAISSSWLVKKPTVDGLVHSLEIFDPNGEMIVQFFGKRKPGIPETELWRNGINQVAGSSL